MKKINALFIVLLLIVHVTITPIVVIYCQELYNKQLSEKIVNNLNYEDDYILPK